MRSKFMRTMRLGLGALAMLVSLQASATVFRLSFSTELETEFFVPPGELFPAGAFGLRRTVASGSFLYDMDLQGTFEAFVTAPVVHLENQLFYNGEDWTWSFEEIQGLTATPTDWAIDKLHSDIWAREDGSYGFGLWAWNDGNRGFQVGGAKMGPPPRLDFLYVGSNVADWHFSGGEPARTGQPVVSSSTAVAMPEPAPLWLVMAGLPLLGLRRSRHHPG